MYPAYNDSKMQLSPTRFPYDLTEDIERNQITRLFVVENKYQNAKPSYFKKKRRCRTSYQKTTKLLYQKTISLYRQLSHKFTY